MSSDVNLPSDSPAPLPWYPPICHVAPELKQNSKRLQSYAKKLKAIRNWSFSSGSSVKNPEKEIEAQYDIYSPERNYHELGARVNAAMTGVRFILFIIS